MGVYLNGHAAEALRLLVTAEARCQAVEMSVTAASVRRARGQLLGDAKGENLIASAEVLFLQADGVVNPARFCRRLFSRISKVTTGGVRNVLPERAFRF